MRTRDCFPALITVLLLCQHTSAQVIHKDELNCFAGWFDVVESGQDVVMDGSRFTEWFVDDSCLAGGRSARLRELSVDLSRRVVTFGRPIDEKANALTWYGSWGNRADPNWRTYRWVIMEDYFVYEVRRNVMTVWQTLPSDSLEFVCAQAGPFDSWLATAWVRKVILFPDNSLLMVVEKAGEGSNSYQFLRGETPCEFEVFYEVNFDRCGESPHKNFERVTFNLDKLVNPYYRLAQTTEYYSMSPDTAVWLENGREHLDSTKAEVVDLWDLAVEHFGIIPEVE